MKLQSIKKGFTLIELLVVITIIGILATGGVSVFTTQLQGARDSTRISDMKLIETGIYQYFSDIG
jgi:general secretion pathway protein G